MENRCSWEEKISLGRRGIVERKMLTAGRRTVVQARENAAVSWENKSMLSKIG
jgi:hypothetical protein